MAMRVCMCVCVFPFVLSLSPYMSSSIFFAPCSIFQYPWKVSNVNVSTVYQCCNCLYTFRTPFLPLKQMMRTSVLSNMRLKSVHMQQRTPTGTSSVCCRPVTTKFLEAFCIEKSFAFK